MNLVAGQVEIPHDFSAGSKAVAAHVNDNFSALKEESNSQDTRINALEAVSLPAVNDQLICIVYYTWPTSGSAYDCAQRSDSSNIRSLTYSQVAQEGWTAISVGGDGNNRVTYIFSK